MNKIKIEYGHEFISNRVVDELLLYNIWECKTLELEIINQIQELFNFNIGRNRNINTLSGGQRSVTYIITLTFIKRANNIKDLSVELTNIFESLTENYINILIEYLKENDIGIVT